MEEFYILAFSQALLSLLSYTIQYHLPRAGTIYSGHPTPIINDDGGGGSGGGDKMPHWLTWQRHFLNFLS